MGDSGPRYEYRIFSASLRGLEAAVRAEAALLRYRESLELYLLLPGREDLNLKIRDDRLSVKRRIARIRRGSRELEQWRPEPELRFPVDPCDLVRYLDGAPSLPGRPLADRTAVAAAFRALAGGGAVASVFKQRFGFEIDGCPVEIVDLLVNGARLASAAVESEDPDAVVRLLDRLGVAAEENVGYARAIARVTGLSALPEGAHYNAEQAVKP